MKRPEKKTNLIIGALVTATFIYLSFTGLPFFESLEKVIYEIEMRLDTPRNPGESKVAIVNIDDKSIDKLGKLPWKRHIIAEMITILKDNGAKVIGLDIIFDQKEQNPSIAEIRNLRHEILSRDAGRDSGKKDKWILVKLKEIEKNLDNDGKLSQAVKSSGNIVLPVVGEFGKYETELVIPPESFPSTNTLRKDKVNIQGLLSVKELTVPFDELSKSSRSLGHINLSPNKIMMGQVHIPFIDFRGIIVPSMPLYLALDYLNKHPEQVIVNGSGIKLGEEIIPTNWGEMFIKFKGGRRSFPYYSFVDILNVKKIPAVFDGKIVLIGLTAKGGVSVNTPVDPYMPRIEFMANLIEGLLSGRFLKRSSIMIYMEALILMLLGLTFSFFHSRLSYLNRSALTAGLIFFTFLTSATLFIGFDIWLKTIYIILCLVTIYGIIMGKDLLSIGTTGVSKDAIEINRELGLAYQEKGLLDLAFEKFRKCPLDDQTRDILYNLGLDFERKRMINKAISVYEYINKKGKKGVRDLNERIPKLKKALRSLPLEAYQGRKEEKIVVMDDLEVKPTVGRYEILMKLGEGAMGTVYKGRDPKINRLLAIKTIRFADEFEENRLEEVKDRFLREAELAGNLLHPGIVAIYDVGEDYDLTYMAMEFLEGEDLEKYCRKGSLLPIRKTLDIVAETADALEYAHNNGVVHRDIKPANITLLKNGKIKVTDFGIAKSMSTSKTRSGTILGTPNYMSPEQIMGHQIDARSDIFSLGVVFFQLLTGEVPFRGENLNSLFYLITQVRHPSPTKLNPRVMKPCEQIIDKALAKNTDHRFQRARDLAKYLRIPANKIDILKAQKKKETNNR